MVLILFGIYFLSMITSNVANHFIESCPNHYPYKDELSYIRVLLISLIPGLNTIVAIIGVLLSISYILESEKTNQKIKEFFEYYIRF